MKAYEAYLLVALALACYAVSTPDSHQGQAAAGGALALVLVGIIEALQRRYRRPEGRVCLPPFEYCGVCDDCQAILRMDDVIERTGRVDFDFPTP